MARPSSRHKITFGDWDFNPNAATRMRANGGARLRRNRKQLSIKWRRRVWFSTAATETFAMAAGFNFPAPSTANPDCLRDGNNFSVVWKRRAPRTSPIYPCGARDDAKPAGGRGGDVYGAKKKTPPTKSHRPRRRQTRQACRRRGVFSVLICLMCGLTSQRIKFCSAEWRGGAVPAPRGGPCSAVVARNLGSKEESRANLI